MLRHFRSVKLSNRWLGTLINEGEIHTKEINFRRYRFSADKYFHLPNLVGQKDFHPPKRNFHVPNGGLVGAFRHPGVSTLLYEKQLKVRI